VCPYCPGAAYQTTGHLETHIETVHEKRRDHVRVPLLRGCRLRAEQPPEEHIETVHEKCRDPVCGYCKGVAFWSASTLKAHTRHQTPAQAI